MARRSVSSWILATRPRSTRLATSRLGLPDSQTSSPPRVFNEIGPNSRSTSSTSLWAGVSPSGFSTPVIIRLPVRWAARIRNRSSCSGDIRAKS